MNWSGLPLVVRFVIISLPMLLTATIYVSSKLKFNPIKPATWGTAWSMRAIDSIGEIFGILLLCWWLLEIFLQCCCRGYVARWLVLFYALLLQVFTALYLAKAGFLLDLVVCLLIALVLLLLLLSRSCFKLLRFLFWILFITFAILWFMFVGGMARLQCSTDSDCAVGLYCQSCRQGILGPRCVPLPIKDPFKLVNNSLPFNKYAFLTTHNSYAIEGEPSRTGVARFTFTNQEDSITQQLNNGVRALMLDTYDFEGDIWLCHSLGGGCYGPTAFGPAIDTMKEIEAFLSQNPSEIVTLILEDYVQAPNGLTKLFNDSGLSKYWFPLSNMPLNGQDWPLVSDMVGNNQRLIVFTSIKSKQDTEGIAYQWNYMVENQHGDDGMHPWICSNRNESSPLRDKSKSLVLVNYFKTIPFQTIECVHHWRGLINMLHTCYGAAGDRWANFVAVDYYKRSDEKPFQAVNTLNGKLLCGCDDVHACVRGSTAGTGTPLRMHDASIKYMKGDSDEL